MMRTDFKPVRIDGGIHDQWLFLSVQHVLDFIGVLH